MKAGATQKDTTSARESNSTPNWVVVLVSRATLPSRMSRIIPTKTATAASTNDEVRPRAEPDPPVPLTRLELVPRPHSAHDAAGEHPRDLSHPHARAVPLQGHRAAPVQLRGLIPIRGQEASLRVLDVSHEPRHGGAVHVHVEGR